MSTIIDILKKTHALLENSHFVLTSGKHSPTYINKDALYIHTKEASKVGLMFAKKFKDDKIDVVAAPALGGIILSQWTAHHLSILKKKEVLAVYTEKTADKNQIFTRGYDTVVKNKNVLVIEDLTTTGGSVKKVVDSVRNAKGIVTCVGVMINRNTKEVNSSLFGAPFMALGELETKNYEPNDCPLCKKTIPINTSVGHGKKYLEQTSH